jgi:hypothetical protein
MDPYLDIIRCANLDFSMTQCPTKAYLKIFGVLCIIATTQCGVKKPPRSPVKASGPHIEWNPGTLNSNQGSTSDESNKSETYEN